jgi:methylenetetrahydrofolate dehydrogenase (NADP+)/methenyltetrahydrofolate cyclohydrolase
MGKLLLGQGGFLPCTPNGVIVLLQELKIPISGSHVVVIGRSNIVGKPLALLLARREQNATVTLCHTGTKDLPSFTRQADILVSAAGKAGLIKGGMIKKGAVVIDAGFNMDAATGKLSGDVVFEEALQTAGWITPVPGGVGPMTQAMLLRNVLAAAEEDS